jgi:hypothetical protein
MTELQIGLYPKMQAFWDDPNQLKILQKGRQTGATISGVYDIIHKALSQDRYILWLDTNYNMVETYWQKYWLPVLSKVDKRHWKYDKLLRRLELFGTTVIFKSYNNPADIEGDNYGFIIVNECGHILKKDQLMRETIYPMILTTRGQIALIGTPKWLGEAKPLTDYYYYQLVSGAPANGWSVHKLTYKDNPYQFEDMQQLVTSNMDDITFRQDMLGEFVQGNERVNLWAKPTILNEEHLATYAITDGQMMLTLKYRSGRAILVNLERWTNETKLRVKTSHHQQGKIIGADIIYMRKMPKFDLVMDLLNKAIEGKRILFAAENENIFNYLNGIREDSDLTILSILLS